MDGLDRDFEFLVASARRSVDEASSAVERVSRVRRSKRGAALSAHVVETLKAIEDRIGASATRFAAAADDVERAAAIEAMRLINGFLSQMQEAAPWIKAGAEPTLELGALYAIDEAATAVVGMECDVVAFADATYQYATVSWPFSSILTQLGKSPTTGPRPVVIFYPPGDAQVFLLHPLFAHELGHSAALQHGLTTRVLATKAGDAAWTAAYEAAASDLAARLTAGDLTVARLMLSRQLRKWVTELICDDFGAHYAGPAYVFAFAATVVAFSWNEPQPTHPPTTTRVGFLLRELDHLGWMPLLTATIPAVSAWLKHVASAPSAPTVTAHESFLIDATEEMRSAIRAEVAGVLGPKIYGPADYTPYREEIDALLSDRILPAQLQSGVHIDRRTIQTAGWLHVLSNRRTPASEGDRASSISAGVANIEYQEFLAKGAEMSTVLETWRSS